MAKSSQCPPSRTRTKNRVFTGDRLGKALAEIDCARKISCGREKVVSVNAVFDGTRFEKFEAELGFRFRPKHLLDVPEDEEVYLEAIQSCGFLLNEWTEKQGHWLSREEAIKQVINFNREAKRKPCHDLRWAVCVEIGQAFENELITCEMTSLVGHLQRSTRYPVRIVTPTADEIKKHCGRKAVSK